MTPYKPNFKNYATNRRCRKALGFVLSAFKGDKSRELYTREIDKYFTSGSNDISKYLRKVLLIPTATWYDPEEGKCKEYKLNREGVLYLQYKVDHTDDPISYRRFLADLEDDTCSSSVQTFINQPQQPRDQALIDLHIAINHSAELKSLNFVYNQKCYRYWNPLQNLASDIRDEVLAQAGLKFKYDCVACAPTLIYQKAQKIDPSLKCNYIEAYLMDRTLIRSVIANDSETDYEMIKKIINSMFAGAKLGYGEHFSITKMFEAIKDTEARAKIMYLQQDDFVVGLKRDIKKCWAVIRETLPKYYDNGRLMSLKSSDKWLVYFELEKMILDEVQRFVKNTHNKIFLVHDGWTTKYAIDLDDLIDVIYQRTGYKVDIECSIYGEKS